MGIIQIINSKIVDEEIVSDLEETLVKCGNPKDSINC